MFTDMENWAEIRRRVLVDGLGKRAACREFDIHWDTLTKILRHPEPPGYRRATPRPRPKLDPFLPVLHQILEEDRKVGAMNLGLRPEDVRVTPVDDVFAR